MMPVMNITIAYLISAYKDEKQLLRLITSLDENAYFFIHIDKKSSFSPSFYLQLKSKNNIFLTPRRFYVNWGSFAQVLYQKELLELALSCGIKFNRLVCLSGQDYPIWSNAKIRKEFEENPQKEYIAGYNITKNNNKRIE